MQDFWDRPAGVERDRKREWVEVVEVRSRDGVRIWMFYLTSMLKTIKPARCS